MIGTTGVEIEAITAATTMAATGINEMMMIDIAETAAIIEGAMAGVRITIDATRTAVLVIDYAAANAFLLGAMTEFHALAASA